MASKLQFDTITNAAGSGAPNFSSGLTSSDGAVGTPAIAFASDTSTGLYRIGTGDMAIATSGVKRLEVSTSVLTSTLPIQITGTGSAAAPQYSFASAANYGMFYSTSVPAPGAGLEFALAGTNYLELIVESSDLQLNVGKNAVGSGNTASLILARTSSISQYGMTVFQVAATGTGDMIQFLNSASAVTGTITSNLSALTTAYNTSSDIRLKTNIQDFNGLAMVAEMRPVQYERYADLGTKEYGFIAQELSSILPQAVTPGREAKDMWMMDYGKVTGVLTKAIQELALENKDLRNRIYKLEAK